MTNNPYQTPSSKLTEAHAHTTAHSIKPFMVTLVLIGITIVVAIILTVVEAVLNLDRIPGTQFISTFVPAYGTGYYFANKYGGFMPRKTRIMALVYLFIISVIITAPIVWFIMPEILSAIGGFKAWMWLVMVAVIIISFLMSYAFIYLGEKTTLKQKSLG